MAMRLLSFNALRTLDFPGVRYVKPERIYHHRDEVMGADFVLYPEYWQVNLLRYAWKVRLFPSAATYHLGHDKIEMTRALWAVAPAHVPETLILPRSEQALEEALDTLGLPLVAKEVRSSMGQGVHLITERRALWDYATHHEILYFQERLPIQRDLRVVYVGREPLTAYWRAATTGSFHNNVAQGGMVSFADIPEDALTLVTQVAQTLGIDHAGFDLARVDGHWYFLEFNPLFGNQALMERNIPLTGRVISYLQACLAAELDPAVGNLGTPYP
ncbi:Ribosomal protein S6--L-glutamate ligase [Gammaproteobacteria bacterium]